MFKTTKSLYVLTVIVFLLLSGWWGFLQLTDTPTDFSLELFSGVYGVMALIGGLIGLNVSRSWGGHKSYVGRAILMFSLGLLAQEFGQIVYSIYSLGFHVEIPYPSIGDIGYFGSVLFYIYGVGLLLKAVAVKLSLKSLTNKISVLVVPVLILALSYVLLLRGYVVDWEAPFTTLLDFGYPLGQAFYLALAILVYVLSRKYLGGVMRPLILTLLLALGVQYIADFMFVYTTNKETWTTAGSNDYTYLVAYFVMTMVLIRFKSVLTALSKGGSSQEESE